MVDSIDVDQPEATSRQNTEKEVHKIMDIPAIDGKMLFSFEDAKDQLRPPFRAVHASNDALQSNCENSEQVLKFSAQNVTSSKVLNDSLKCGISAINQEIELVKHAHQHSFGELQSAPVERPILSQAEKDKDESQKVTEQLAGPFSQHSNAFNKQFLSVEIMKVELRDSPIAMRTCSENKISP